MKIFFSIIMCSLHSVVVATDLLMSIPPQYVLEGRFEQVGLEKFVKYTSIMKDVAGKQLLPSGVALAVDMAIVEYCSRIHEKYYNYSAKKKCKQMKAERSRIIKLILWNDRAAFDEWKRAGVLYI